MGNWTITVAQLPIGSTGRFHNMILIRDDARNIRAEIDGGPADGHGHLIGLGSNNAFQAGTAYTSGMYPVGAEIFKRSTYYPSATSRENMDDWFWRWVKPLLDR